MTTAPEQNAGRGRRRGKAAPQQPGQPLPPNAPVARTTAAASAELKPVSKKRRPAMMALALALIALSALGGVWLVNQGQQTVQIIRVSTDVQRGEILGAEHLAAVDFPADLVGFETVRFSELDSIVGQVALRELHSGSLLSPDSFGAALDVPPGRAQVGITVPPDRLPGTIPSAGDPVVLVETPGGAANDLGELVPATWHATYISQVPVGTSGEIRVNVEIDFDDAVAVAARAGVDRLVIFYGEKPGE